MEERHVRARTGASIRCARVAAPPRTQVLPWACWKQAALWKWPRREGAEGEPGQQSPVGPRRVPASCSRAPALTASPDHQHFPSSRSILVSQGGNNLSGKARLGSALMFIPCSVTQRSVAHPGGTGDGAERFGRGGLAAGGCELSPQLRPCRRDPGWRWGSHSFGGRWARAGGRHWCCEAAGRDG